MIRRIVVVGVCTIVGAILGPILGMTLMERMYGFQDAQGPGFVGFVHGLWVGPIVGFLIGIAILAFRRPPPDPGR